MSCVRRLFCSLFRTATCKDGNDDEEVYIVVPESLPMVDAIRQQPPSSKISKLRMYMAVVRFAVLANRTVVRRIVINGCCNVRRLRHGDPTTAVTLLQHTHSQGYLAVQGNQVICIPLQDNDPTFRMALDVYKGAEMSRESKHHYEPDKNNFVMVLAIHQSETISSFVSASASTPRQELYLCSSDDAETAERQTISLQPMTECCLDVLPSDTSPQFFYQIPAKVDGCFSLESTSMQGNFLYVEGRQVFLKKTTIDDVKTHFTRCPIPSN